MNLQESIRRILREETHLSTYIRRRLDFDMLDNVFNDVIKHTTELQIKNYKNLNYKGGLTAFINVTISKLIREIEHQFYDSPADKNWFNNLFNYLKNIYSDRIKEVYDTIEY
jgi:hypothetical protein